MRHLNFQIYFAVLAFFLTTGASFALPPCSGSNTKYWDNCFGNVTHSNGNTYVGDWRNGKAHGYGAFKLAQDTCWGNLCYPAGGKYAGEFKNDAANGYGIATYPSGKVEEGFFKNNKFLYSAPSRLKPAFYKFTKSSRRLLQSNLSKVGFYTSSIDGLYGPNTQKALTAYNRRYLNAANLKSQVNIDRLFSTILNAGTYSSTSNIAPTATPKQTCKQKPALCSATELCEMAIYYPNSKKAWKGMTSAGHVKEAKRRGYTCGVDTKTSSRPTSRQPFSGSQQDLQGVGLLILLAAAGFFFFFRKTREDKATSKQETQNARQARGQDLQPRAQAASASKKAASKSTQGTIRVISTEEEFLEAMSVDQMMPPDVMKTSGYGSLTFKCGCGDFHGVNDPSVQKIASFHPIKILCKCPTHYTKVRIRGLFVQKCVSEWTIENKWMAEFNRKLGL